MSEIDVSKCDYYKFGDCYRYDFPLNCAKCSDCYYKQLQQLKQENEGLQSLNDFNVQKIETLEAENEELRKSNTSNAKAFLKENKEKHKFLDCLDEIENICKTTICDYPMNKVEEIKKLIKQAKEGGE